MSAPFPRRGAAPVPAEDAAPAPAPVAAVRGGRAPWLVKGAVVVSFLLLNLATLLNARDAAGQETRSPVYVLWLAAPALLWLLGFRRLLVARRTGYWAVCLTFAYLLMGHAGIMAVTESLTTGVAAFMAWGLWLGAFLWLSFGPLQRDWPRMLLLLFMLGGVLNALPVIYEWSSGSALLKVARIGDVVRRYGVSQSISVLGVQLGAGIMATLYFGTAARGPWGRVFAHVLALVQWAALLLVASRGPLIFSAAALLIVTYAERRRSRFVRQHAMVVGAGIVAGLGVLVVSRPDTLQLANFVAQAFSSEDVSNQVRSQRWLDGIRAVAENLGTLVFGMGSGSSVAIPNLRGNEGTTHESSLVKLLYELGMVGVGLLTAILWPPVRRAFALLRRRDVEATAEIRRTVPPILGVMLLVLMETAIHDMIMAWIIALYFWLTLGTLWQLVRQADALRAAAAEGVGAAAAAPAAGVGGSRGLVFPGRPPRGRGHERLTGA